MKHCYLPKAVCILFVFILYHIDKVFCQTQSNVTTPKNSAVVAFITPEDNASTRAAYDANYATANRILINYFNDGYSSSGRFNCHGYAWHMIEGGSPRWIGYYVTTDEDIYMTDGSYIQVCNETFPGKISWANGDHSAITTSTPGRVTSKWNRFPLMTHNLSDNPFGTVYKYYFSTKISGSTSPLCSGTRTFSVQNVSGVTYSWTYSSSLSVIGSVNTSQITVQRNGSSVAAAWVSVEISTSCSASPIINTLNFNAGSPPLSISSSTNGCNGSYQIWNLVNNTPNNGTNWFWSVSYLGTNSQINIYTPSTPSTYLSVKGGGAVRLNYTDLCGVAATDGVTVYSTCGGYRIVVSPNPAKNDMNVSFVPKSKDNTEFNSTADITPLPNVKSQGKTIISLFDVSSNRLTQQWQKNEAVSKNYNLNINGLRKGVYILQIDRDDQTTVTKVIIE